MFKLDYPHIGSVTDSVTLKNPSFGNSVSIDTHVINRVSRHGTIITGHPSAWGYQNTRKYNFETIDKDTKDNFIDFLETVSGLKIKITDHNDEELTGIIITNENEIITMQDACSYDISFEFLEV